MQQKNIEEEKTYTIPVQILGFSMFWILPTFWISYLSRVVFHLESQLVLIWIGMVILNLATQTKGQDFSSRINSYIFNVLILLQIYAWIFR
jgi:hypothetical protein